MTDDLLTRLGRAPMVPLIEAEDPATAVKTAQALVAGGLSVIEVVLRTDGAHECMRQIIAALPDAIVGAGTVLTANQATIVADTGAAFIVSPGLDVGVVEVSKTAGLPIFPGIATASELQQAWNLGIEVVKFFPADLNGGTSMLKALSSVFRNVKFMPTGGISADNLADYLALPTVIACGGSWLTPTVEINAANFEGIRKLAEDALVIANDARKK